ncbi:uncharacterized protein LOC110854621 [Folsomia candida]|uniref:C2H2-type domain-containing protein n=1 Tax=Folsomia candida TaxID=158441 RepID=A0A226DYM0_FOLCA|nr:uncharacterized protein LOC110854621 [Folsomia candida]OXA49306.1 hypothetical protein Fcan01_15734 [Folsomia candida]
MAAKSFIPRGSGNLIRDLLSPTCSIPLNKLHLKVDPKLNYPPELFSYFLPQRIDAIRITSLSPCLICSVDTELNPISSAETEILNQMRLKISKTRGNYAMVRDSSICATCRKMMGKMRKLRQQLVKIETCLKFAIRLKLDKVEEAGNINSPKFNHSDLIPLSDTFPSCHNSPSKSYHSPNRVPILPLKDDDPPPPTQGGHDTDAPIPDHQIPSDLQLPSILPPAEDEMYSVIVIKSSELGNVLRDPGQLQELLNKQNSQIGNFANLSAPVKVERNTEGETSSASMDTSHQEATNSGNHVRNKITRKNPRKSWKMRSFNIPQKKIPVKKVAKTVTVPVKKIKTEPDSFSKSEETTIDPDQGIFRCEICMQDFTVPGNLRVHLYTKGHHEGVRGRREKPDGSVVFGCDRCDYESFSPQLLLQHKSRRRNDIRHL